MSLHHLAIMTKPSLSCLLCFLCMLAIPIFPFLKVKEFLIYLYKLYMYIHINLNYVSQRGDSPFVYRDGTGWPASLPYIQKIRVSVAIGIRSGIRLHERVPTCIVKIWRYSKNDQNRTMGKSLKLQKFIFIFLLLLSLLLLLLFSFSTHLSQKPD